MEIAAGDGAVLDRDAEDAAVYAFAARATRLRRIVMAPFVLAGLCFGVLGALLLGAAQQDTFGVEVVGYTRYLGFGVPFVLFLFTGSRVGRLVVASRTAGWIAELAPAHHVDAAVFDTIAIAARNGAEVDYVKQRRAVGRR